MPVLTRHQLNRTLLQRQFLLERADIPVYDAMGALAGMQSQIPNPPYIGLWTRLKTFQRDDLTRLMEEKRVVRAAMMRATLHLVTEKDHNRFRAALQPALEKAHRSFNGKAATEAIDNDKLVSLAKPFIEEKPRTTGELREHLLAAMPEHEGATLTSAARTFLPLVQVPPGGTWGSSSRAAYTTAESVLGPLDLPDMGALLHAYLAAYGPASIMDFQFWTGLTNLKNVIKPLTKYLVRYEDENGKELLDLPDKPLADENTPAPVRFMPEYDNLVIAHKDRTRILADEDYKKVFLSAARVLSTVLVDGFVAGTWTIQREKKAATLTISPFRPFDEATCKALTEEGERLVRFIEDEAETVTVTFAEG